MTEEWTAKRLTVDEGEPLEVDPILTDAEEKEVEGWLKKKD
jgi:hypothetical protein